MVHHFADDTNLLLFDNSLKSMKKKINIDLKLLCQWLAANKISLNSSKTEYILFRHKLKPINYQLKIKIDGKKLYPSTFITNTLEFFLMKILAGIIMLSQFH